MLTDLARELLLRKKVRDIVICCPPSMLLQWKDEMANRFGLAFEILDKAYVTRIRRERGYGVNPWETHTRFLVSQRLLIDEGYTNPMRDWLREFRPGSLLILDEAHHAAPSSGQKYAIDSQITKTVRELAPCFEHRLFLSATPHNGHSNSFAALLEILDPQRFTRGVPVRNVGVLKQVMVRRLKDELRPHLRDPIPKRLTPAIVIDGLPTDAPELVLAQKLGEYADILERRTSEGGPRLAATAKLVTIALQKRLLSSIEAFARTLSVHRKSAAQTLSTGATRPTVAKAAPPSQQLGLLEGDDECSDEQIAEQSDVEVARATRAGATAADDRRAEALLDEMTELADRTRNLPDAKVRALIEWIRANQCPDLPASPASSERRPPKPAAWLPRRLLIFTEFVHTKDWLVEQLRAAIAQTDRADDRILTLHGGMDDEDHGEQPGRESVKAAFNADPTTHPVRILVATDAAREGINLQAHCADLIHFDLPWNPARMEQRNGRIDRILQPSREVRCHYFFYAQRPEDAVLDALVKKTRRIHAELGSLSDVVDRHVTQVLEQGISRARLRELVEEIGKVGAPPATAGDGDRRVVVEDELEGARDVEIIRQLEELEKLEQKAREHLDLRPERLRDAVSLGLTVSGAPPLSLRTSPLGSYDVPRVDEMAGADGTWREIVDTLRAPRTKKMPMWKWREENPPRPVSFEPATTLSSETVQLHLNHKLAQRALARFRSQAFGEDRLSRVAVVLDPTHSRKRVLALGRLSVFGAGAARLHEELLVSAAYWAEGKGDAHLKPFETTEAQERALEGLFAALSRQDQPPFPEHITKMLMASAAGDEEALWGALTARADERVTWARERLDRRATVEAEEMRRILEGQRGAIERELEKRRQRAEALAGPHATQLAMPGIVRFTVEEEQQREQYERDTEYIRRRLRDLASELDSEPARIRALYDVKHHRIERVGLVYLWPTTS